VGLLGDESAHPDLCPAKLLSKVVSQFTLLSSLRVFPFFLFVAIGKYQF
jgi:hypothetical protein